MNHLYSLNCGYLLIESAKRPNALMASSKMIRRLTSSRKTAIVSPSGEHTDEMIRTSGMAAAEQFDRIMIPQKEHRHGRIRGEVAHLFQEAALSKRPIECEIEVSPSEAFKRAVREMEPNELVVFYYDEINQVQTLLKEYNVVLN
jgi:UDP-N-acetylmuramyl tripeptide synthase